MDATELLELLKQQHQLLRLLEVYGHEQIELIAGDQMTALLELLTEKQRVLECFGDLQQKLAPVLVEDPSLRNWPDPTERQSAKELHAECQRMLKGILEQEAQCEAQMQVGRTRLLERMSFLQQATFAVNAYEAEPAPASQHDFGLS